MQAMEQIDSAECQIEIVPNAAHLFEELGTLEEVARRKPPTGSCAISAKKDEDHEP